jgi:hypothetical protein
MPPRTKDFALCPSVCPPVKYAGNLREQRLYIGQWLSHSQADCQACITHVSDNWVTWLLQLVRVRWIHSSILQPLALVTKRCVFMWPIDRGPLGTGASSTCDGLVQGGTWCNANQSQCEGGCGGKWCTRGTVPPPTPPPQPPTTLVGYCNW